MIKLIASDMDGTLLHPDNTLPKDFAQLFSILEEKGIIFCAASGRQYNTLISYFNQYKDRMAFIAENGGYITFSGREIFQESLEKPDIRFIIEECNKISDIGIILCGKNGAYLNSSDEDILKFFKTYYPNYQIVDNLVNIDDIIFKIAIYDKKGTFQNSFHQLKNWERFKIALSGKKCLDISKKEINKGRAIKFLQKKLGISSDETMVFGDYLNDLEMMQEAKYSFAMKNAHPEIKAVANFVTEYDNSQNGVIKTILKELEI